MATEAIQPMPRRDAAPKNESIVKLTPSKSGLIEFLKRESR